MQKIYNSCVMVVGAGAVGGYVIEALARSGVGKLIIVDFDSFDISNINRQIFALTSTIGRKKVEVAKERVRDINPECEVIIKEMFVNSDNVEELFSYNPDFIVDAIDSLNPKCNLIAAMVSKEIKFISSMGAARKTDPFSIKLGSLSKTVNCSLSKFVRKRLKRRGVDINLVNCVSSTEAPMGTNLEVFDEETIENSERLPLGSMPTITAIFGLVIANEVIRQISGVS